MGLIRGLNFSWRRFLGIDLLKRRVAAATGIPFTRAGRQAKLGRMFGMK